MNAMLPAQPSTSFEQIFQERIKLVFLLPHQHMALPLPHLKLNALTELLLQQLRMMKRNHPIIRTMQHGDPLSSNLLRDLRYLFGTLMMPSRRNCLQYESLSRETFFVVALVQLARGETVAVCRIIQPGVGGLFDVWLLEEFVGEESVGDLVKLHVDVARDEHVDPLPEVLDKGHGADESRSRRHETEGCDVLRNKERNFLGDHAAHTDPYDVQVSCWCR